MRTKVWVVVVVLLLAGLLVAAGAAQAKAPLRCQAELYSDATMDHWEVAISGDVEGTMYVHGDPDHEFSFPGKTEHFFETWDVYSDSGDWLFSGTDAGVWSFVTFKFRANGWVTDASPEWEYLVGHKFHEVGTTSDPFTAPGPLYAVTGDADMFFAGP